MHEFRGQFETHVTVEPRTISELLAWAQPRGLKCLQIELSRGITPVQPMLTWRGTGLLSDQMARLEAICGDLAEDGYRVVRSKVEAAPTNDDVPFEDFSTLCGSRSRYFEHHIKLLLPDNVDTRHLTQIAESHHSHLSANALRRRDDGF